MACNVHATARNVRATARNVNAAARNVNVTTRNVRAMACNVRATTRNVNARARINAALACIIARGEARRAWPLRGSFPRSRGQRCREDFASRARSRGRRGAAAASLAQ